MPQAVKKFTSGSLPFENGEIERVDEIRRVPGRSGEGEANTQTTVWQDFSGDPFEVRKVGTIERKIVLK